MLLLLLFFFFIINFKVEVKCEKTGYKADIEFLTKSFFVGKSHKITGSIYKINDKSNPIMTLNGEWNNLIYAKKQNEKEFLFSNVREKLEVKKVGIFIFNLTY